MTRDDEGPRSRFQAPGRSGGPRWHQARYDKDGRKPSPDRFRRSDRDGSRVDLERKVEQLSREIESLKRSLRRN